MKGIRYIVTGSIFILILSTVCYSGQRTARKARPHKFDEFTLDIFLPSEAKAVQLRLARFAKQVKSVPGSKACIIIYGEGVGTGCRFDAHSTALGTQGAIATLGIRTARIIVLEGGYREKRATELWVVPKGAGLPIPTPTVKETDVVCCPDISVYVEPFVANMHESLKLTAAASRYNASVPPAFSWNISNGKIGFNDGPTLSTDGVAKNSITVEPESLTRNVVAEVTIAGYSPECPNRNKITVSISNHFKLTEQPKMACEELGAHLADLFLALRDEPDFQAHIVVYGGRHGKHHEADVYASFIRENLIEESQVDGSRLFKINGGYREEFTYELWLCRKGEGAPPLSPNFEGRYVRLKGNANKPVCSD